MSRNDCPTTVILSAHLDGELSGRPARQLGAHLAACRACSHELAELSDLRDQVAAMSLPEPATEQLWRQLDLPESAQPTWHGPLLSPDAAPWRVFAGAAAFVAGLGLWLALPHLGAAPQPAGRPDPPPVALTVGDYVHQASAGAPERFWERFAAVDARRLAVEMPIDFRARVPEQLPGEFRLVGVKLLKDVCCYTVQARYVSPSGELDVFECHDDHPLDLGPVDARRGRAGDVAYTDLEWAGTDIRGRLFSNASINIVFVGRVAPALADALTRELGRASD